MNTLSLSRFASIVAVALALATPFASQAHDADAAMDTCIDAFVAARLPKERPVKVRKQAVDSSPIVMRSRAYRIVVTAKGADSGKRLARGTCIVNRDGEVVAFDGKPFAEKLAAR
jgi:hypothetical protein